MDIGDAAGDRIVDRDHREIGLVGAQRGEHVLEGRARQGLVVPVCFAAGQVRVGAGLALECDFLTFCHAVRYALLLEIVNFSPSG